MATFGRCSESGATSYGAAYDRIYLTKATLNEDGDVTKISIYGKAASGSIHMKAAIYSDNNGQPNALQGVSAEVTVNTTLKWWDFSFSPAVSLTAGTWWIGWNHDGPVDFTYYYVTESGMGRWMNYTYNSFPDPIGSMNSINKSLCVCATYTPSGGGLSIPVAMRHYRNLRTAITRHPTPKLEFPKITLLRI